MPIARMPGTLGLRPNKKLGVFQDELGIRFR